MSGQRAAAGTKRTARDPKTSIRKVSVHGAVEARDRVAGISATGVGIRAKTEAKATS